MQKHARKNTYKPINACVQTYTRALSDKEIHACAHIYTHTHGNTRKHAHRLTETHRREHRHIHTYRYIQTDKHTHIRARACTHPHTECSFTVGDQSLWNDLPDNIKEAGSIELFKQILKTLVLVKLSKYRLFKISNSEFDFI